MTANLPTPAQVVDHAFELRSKDQLKVRTLGEYASWNPRLLHRAHNEAIRRWNLAAHRGALNWSEGNAYNGIANALSLAYDRALTGPRRSVA